MIGNPERSLIGCILLNADEIVPTLRGVLMPEHFAVIDYRTIWLQACKLMDDGWPASYRTVVKRLATNRGAADLAKAVHDEMPHAHDWRYYAWLLVEQHERGVLGVNKPGDLVEIIEQRLHNLTQSRTRLRAAKRILSRHGGRATSPTP